MVFLWCMRHLFVTYLNKHLVYTYCALHMHYWFVYTCVFKLGKHNTWSLVHEKVLWCKPGKGVIPIFGVHHNIDRCTLILGVNLVYQKKCKRGVNPWKEDVWCLLTWYFIFVFQVDRPVLRSAPVFEPGCIRCDKIYI